MRSPIVHVANEAEPRPYEVTIRSAAGELWQRHLFFDREEALAIVQYLTRRVVDERHCLIQTEEETDRVHVTLYDRYGGPPEASIEMRSLH